MPKNRIIIILATCVALLPLVGFPKAWESFFQVLAGLAIIAVSTWSTIDRKLKLQAKAQMRLGKRVTDFYPKTGQPGRRVTDLDPTLPTEDLN